MIKTSIIHLPLNRSSLTAFTVLLSLIFLNSCKHDPDLTNVPEVTFSTVQGILSGNCTFSGCHDGAGSNEEEVFSLIGYDNVIDEGKVKPGNARDSELYKVISNRGEKMPPDPRSPLSDDDVKKIYIWIEQGAKNN